MPTLPDMNVGRPSLVFPSDLTSRQQGHFMKIQIFPTKGTTHDEAGQAIFLFIPGGNQNGPLSWPMVHEFDDVKLTRLGAGVVGAVTRLIPGIGDALAEAAGVAGGYGLAGARVKGMGTINPKIDVLYGNSELRRFQFSFFLAPESAPESRTVKNIIKTLRKFSAPEITSTIGGVNVANLPGVQQLANVLGGDTAGNFTGTSGQGSQLKSGLWFVPPAEFLISFHSIVNNGASGFNAPENEYLPKIGRCVLERIDVDFSPGQNEFSTFNDGAPTNVQLTMIFREMRIISQTDIDNGY
jgi:hypothetical protein